MRLAHERGLYWPTICGGKGRCAVCVGHVLEGEEHLLPPSARELETLRRARYRFSSGAIRAACQAVIMGDVTVFQSGVKRRETGDARTLYRGSKQGETSTST
jgi:ferredoxin, 2Fe-2S